MKISFGHICFLTIGLAVVNRSNAWLIFRNRFWNKIFGRRNNKAGPPPPTTSTTTIPSPPPSPPTSTTPTHSCEPTYGYDPVTNWCYGTYCDENGKLLAWDNFNCKPTTTTPPSTPPSSPPRPPGCEYQGRFYPPNTLMDTGEDRSSNWCWSVLCGPDGSILYADDFNCFPTTIPSSTAPSSTGGSVRNVAKAFKKRLQQ